MLNEIKRMQHLAGIKEIKINRPVPKDNDQLLIYLKNNKSNVLNYIIKKYYNTEEVNGDEVEYILHSIDNLKLDDFEMDGEGCPCISDDSQFFSFSLNLLDFERENPNNLPIFSFPIYYIRYQV